MTSYARRNQNWKGRIEKQLITLSVEGVTEIFTDMKVDKKDIKPSAKRLCKFKGCDKFSLDKPSEIVFTPKRNETYCENHWHTVQSWKTYKERRISKMQTAKRIRDTGIYFAGKLYDPKTMECISQNDISAILRVRKKKKCDVEMEVEAEAESESDGGEGDGDGQYDD